MGMPVDAPVQVLTDLMSTVVGANVIATPERMLVCCRLVAVNGAERQPERLELNGHANG